MSRADSELPPPGTAAARALYQELILDHYRRPRNRGVLEGAPATARLSNPLCGDELVVQIAFDGDAVREARFTGRGCSISQAAASMLTTLVRGKDADALAALLDGYTRLIQGDGEAARDVRLGDLRALAGVARFPGRVKCALLARDAIRQALRAGAGPA